jgi:hypothetical protein
VKSITAVPPLESPYAQVNPILVPVVIAALFARLVGVSGTVNMIAPFPSLDWVELPYTFTAVTFA